MFKYSLHLKKGKDIASYGPSVTIRVISLFFSLILFYYFFLSLKEGTYTNSALIPLLLAVILLLTSLVRDEIIFNKAEQKTEIIFGLGPFYKKEVILFSQIEQLELTHFVRGKLEERAKQTKRCKAQIVFLIRLKNGDDKKIEIIGERASAGKIEHTAHQLSQFTHLPLYLDRGEDYNVDLL